MTLQPITGWRDERMTGSGHPRHSHEAPAQHREWPSRAQLQTLTVSSFDHLVGADQQRSRKLDAERLGALEVDDASNFKAHSIGRSAGAVPFRILSTKAAEREKGPQVPLHIR
jgi:hypothetical protein